MTRTNFLAILAFLATSLNLVASAPLLSNAAADWKPDPAACALCPRAFAAFDNERAYTRYAFTDLFTDEKGFCREEEGWKNPSDDYQKHCRHLLGDAPVETIRGPPWGDGAVPIVGHDPNHVWGPHVPDRVYDICSVNGTEFRGKPLIDRKCLRKVLDEREDAIVKTLEPCIPCAHVGHYYPDYTPCWECCKSDHTIDRVCWLKMYHPIETVIKQEVDDDGTKYVTRVGPQMTPWEFWNDNSFFEHFPPRMDSLVEKRSEIAERQLLPPPVDFPVLDCGDWTEFSGEQHAIPSCDCEKLYTNFYGVDPAKPNPYTDYRHHLPENWWHPLLHGEPEIDSKLPVFKRDLQSSDRQAFMNLKTLHCGNWSAPSGEQHAIPWHFCMNYMVHLIAHVDPVLDCDPIRGDCTDVGGELELERCGNWAQALGVPPPTDVDQCFSWVQEYRDWVHCLHHPRLMIDPPRCRAPAFLLNDRNTSSNATANASKILPRDPALPLPPDGILASHLHCGNWTDYSDATHVIPKKVCAALNLQLVNTSPEAPQIVGPGHSNEPEDVPVVALENEDEPEILPPPDDPSVLLEEPTYNACGNWTDFNHQNHTIPRDVCRRLHLDWYERHHRGSHWSRDPLPPPGPRYVDSDRHWHADKAGNHIHVCVDENGSWHLGSADCSSPLPSGDPRDRCEDMNGIWYDDIKYCSHPLDSGHHNEYKHMQSDQALESRSLVWPCTAIIAGMQIPGHRLPDGGCSLAPDMVTHIDHRSVDEETEEHGDGNPFVKNPMPYPWYRNHDIPMIPPPDRADEADILPEDVAENES